MDFSIVLGVKKHIKTIINVYEDENYSKVYGAKDEYNGELELIYKQIEQKYADQEAKIDKVKAETKR